jgi:hypothetical protein
VTAFSLDAGILQGGAMIGTLSPVLQRARSRCAPARRQEVPVSDDHKTAPEAASSFELVMRARGGDQEALNDLCARYLPRLQRWAHGRLPASARGALDTHDLVQETMTNVVQRLTNSSRGMKARFRDICARRCSTVFAMKPPGPSPWTLGTSRHRASGIGSVAARGGDRPGGTGAV